LAKLLQKPCGIGHASELTAVPTDTDEAMEDARMGSIFDIFKVTSDGPLWVEAVRGLEKTKEQMARLALSSPGEYFIHSQEQGVVAKAEGTDGDEYSLPVKSI
jgi:hypothetical protein